MTDVAIVGAGVAGLAAAWALKGYGHTATIFEASGRLGGRASTVERATLRFDDGAQFFRTDTALTAEAVLHRLPTIDLLDIRRDVRPFDSSGALGPGDDAQNAAPKWVYRHGIAHLATLLWRATGATVQLNWSVTSVAPTASGWRVRGDKGDAGPFAAALVTTPPSAARRLVEASVFDIPTKTELLSGLETGRHRPIISVALGLGAALGAPEDAYALVNSDRRHAISWLAFEDAKPGYVPAGHGVLVAQMAAHWSEPRMAATDREVASEAAGAVSGLLDRRITPCWWHVTRWSEALPDALIDASKLAIAEPDGLFVAGDGLIGGRVHLALESGLAAGQRIAAALSGARRPIS